MTSMTSRALPRPPVTTSHLEDLLWKFPGLGAAETARLCGLSIGQIDHTCRLVYGVGFAQKRQEVYEQDQREHLKAVGKRTFLCDYLGPSYSRRAPGADGIFTPGD